MHADIFISLLLSLLNDYRIVKLTSPNLNYVIIAGAFFSYGSIFLRMLPGTDDSSLIARCDVSIDITR